MTVAKLIKIRISGRQKELIEDVIDLGLILFSIVYWIAIDVTGWEMTGATSAKIGVAGGTSRTLFRRILLKMVDERSGYPEKRKRQLRTMRASPPSMHETQDPGSSDPEIARSTVVDEPIVSDRPPP